MITQEEKHEREDLLRRVSHWCVVLHEREDLLRRVSHWCVVLHEREDLLRRVSHWCVVFTHAQACAQIMRTVY